MKHLVRGLFAFAVALAFVGTVSADEKKKDEKKPAVPFAAQFSFPKQIKLTEAVGP